MSDTVGEGKEEEKDVVPVGTGLYAEVTIGSKGEPNVGKLAKASKVLTHAFTGAEKYPDGVKAARPGKSTAAVNPVLDADSLSVDTSVTNPFGGGGKRKSKRKTGKRKSKRKSSKKKRSRRKK